MVTRFIKWLFGVKVKTVNGFLPGEIDPQFVRQNDEFWAQYR